MAVKKSYQYKNILPMLGSVELSRLNFVRDKSVLIAASSV
ncbi:hypothetical protein CPS_2569 [Colwellia psychrerythraea 34H]|uniref:Uncharacterized protein n=1 Tax=Colwellia psychrerythraea (strain 34H / ATCC BAA-681) TaxID=167879 RepID=Q481I5_COLP3|nr:hypothetical protein CPS_2569 [Colwellia psychrerythraea 34H]